MGYNILKSFKYIGYTMNIPQKWLDQFDPQYQNNLKFVERLGLTAFGLLCIGVGVGGTVLIYELVL